MTRVRTYIWTVIFGLLMAAGGYAMFLRFVFGLGAATNLTDQFPWGLWVGFDVLCGVGLAAGGFTLVAAVHIFNIESYKSILRPAIPRRRWHSGRPSARTAARLPPMIFSWACSQPHSLRTN